MDYYGYFPTFNSLAVETQIIVTLIGFIAIFFIFWFNHRYNIATKNKTKELSKEDKTTLIVATLVFIGIMLLGMAIVIDNSNTLSIKPYLLEQQIAEEGNTTISPSLVEKLESHHTWFTRWTIFSFFYILALIFSLDIVNIFTIVVKEEMKEPKGKKKNEKKIKTGKKNVKKNKKLSGGK